MMILSLKRFDLDYNTFETVKVNSRRAFEQTLSMKRYSLEGIEAIEQAENQEADAMDTGNEEIVMGHLADKDYEYKLAGVLVHAGVAQGGHYYSFINDRNPGSEDKWYRFDDEDRFYDYRIIVENTRKIKKVREHQLFPEPSPTY